MATRQSGVMIPLFSLVSSRSWGVGEFRDLAVFARWLRQAGQSFVQILPILEVPESDTSPYSALTAMALDPIYISVDEIEDFQAVGAESRLDARERRTLARIRRAPRVEYRRVRALKDRALRLAYARFVEAEALPRGDRFRQLSAFAAEQASWLDDYALFRALRDAHQARAWWDWPEELSRHDDTALARAREELAGEIGYRTYVQWIAATQWERARREAAPVGVFGDVPFMISADSPDVWGDQREFRFDATVGVPPDAFSETGQDWGLPPWRWDVMAENDFTWMRRRARRSAALFDGFRLDHLVGLYRTYMRPLDPDEPPFFVPAEESQQLELGERLVRLYQESGAEIIAEDLGLVPDFVRASLGRLEVPGFKVFRWERRWSVPDQPFIDPTEYADVSVATSGTHDTETLAAWWDSLDPEEREKVTELPSVSGHLADGGPLDAIVRALVASGSRYTILPIQDIFGWEDRINTPATVDHDNWTWRLPWPVDRLEELDTPRHKADQLRQWSQEAGRAAAD